MTSVIDLKSHRRYQAIGRIVAGSILIFVGFGLLDDAITSLLDGWVGDFVFDTVIAIFPFAVSGFDLLQTGRRQYRAGSLRAV